jgi:D-amino-acid dehydrogenase
MGHRPGTPDSLPVLGRDSRYANLLHAFGHGHTGLMGASVSGHVIADLVAGRRPDLDLAPYRPDRF